MQCLFIFDAFAQAPKYVRDNYRNMERVFGVEPELIAGDSFRPAIESALDFFGHPDPKRWDSNPVHASDWIRTHRMFTAETLYSDSDVTWEKRPALPPDCAQGDGTMGILWSGQGLTESDRERLQEFGFRTDWRYVYSRVLFPSGRKFAGGCFRHDKPFPHPPGGYYPGHYKKEW